MGWFPIRFPGFDLGAEPGHIEGWFRHHIGSPEQALIEGSHWAAADILRAAEPGGLSGPDLNAAVAERLSTERLSRVEVAADAGDVVLAHPLIFHGWSSTRRGITPRVMAQPRFDMIEPKRYRGARLSPVEVPLAGR
jgi:hypothetical protein